MLCILPRPLFLILYTKFLLTFFKKKKKKTHTEKTWQIFSALDRLKFLFKAALDVSSRILLRALGILDEKPENYSKSIKYSLRSSWKTQSK